MNEKHDILEVNRIIRKVQRFKPEGQDVIIRFLASMVYEDNSDLDVIRQLQKETTPPVDNQNPATNY